MVPFLWPTRVHITSDISIGLSVSVGFTVVTNRYNALQLQHHAAPMRRVHAMRPSYYYFASATVAVDSSHMPASLSASLSRISPRSDFVNGHMSTMWFMVCRWAQSLGETPFVQVNTTWALNCPETVHQRPRIPRKIEAWLSDSRVDNNSVVDHRSRRPVLSPLRNCVDRCHVWPYWASRCKPWRWMLKDISIHGPIWMGFDDLKHIVSCRFCSDGMIPGRLGVGIQSKTAIRGAFVAG